MAMRAGPFARAACSRSFVGSEAPSSFCTFWSMTAPNVSRLNCWRWAAWIAWSSAVECGRPYTWFVVWGYAVTAIAPMMKRMSVAEIP